MSESLSSSPAARIGVITFPGTLDDVDAARAVRLAGAEPVSLWHKDADLRGVDAVVVPGGFSYGDYLRCGAIARFAPVMEEVVAAAERGMPVLGICNGFQILAEAHLLPGALLRNANQRFICVEQRLRVENTQTAWTNRYVDGDEIVVPMKNGEGNFIASPEELDRLEGEGLVVFRYVGNPNGSAPARRTARAASTSSRVPGKVMTPMRAEGDSLTAQASSSAVTETTSSMIGLDRRVSAASRAAARCSSVTGPSTVSSKRRP